VPDAVNEARQTLLRSPKKSLLHVSQQMNMSKNMVRKFYYSDLPEHHYTTMVQWIKITLYVL
jgi:hypothetical protein